MAISQPFVSYCIPVSHRYGDDVYCEAGSVFIFDFLTSVTRFTGNLPGTINTSVQPLSVLELAETIRVDGTNDAQADAWQCLVRRRRGRASYCQGRSLIQQFCSAIG